MKQLILLIVVFGVSGPSIAQTNEELLRERLISPMVFEVLTKRGANTPEQRIKAIRDACASGELSQDECYSDRDGRRR